jgi:transcriptional regulator with XRE-family HTH domain
MIKKLRLEAGVSQSQLARKADLDRGTVASAENGGSASELTLSKIAKALTHFLGTHVDVNQLSESAA